MATNFMFLSLDVVLLKDIIFSNAITAKNQDTILTTVLIKSMTLLVCIVVVNINQKCVLIKVKGVVPIA